VDRRIRISLIVVAVLVLAYPLAPWLIGLAAEHQWQAREQVLLQQYPWLEVLERDYHRGVYSSTEELTYRLRGPVVQSLAFLGDGAHFSATVRNTIHHGPLPQMRDFAPATVDTRVILSPEWQARLTGWLGDKASLTIHTRLGWFGGSTTEIHSPPAEKNATDGTTLIWRGLDGTNTVGRDMTQYVADFTSPGFSLKSVAASLDVANLRLQADRRSVFDQVYVGPFNLTLDRLEMSQVMPARQASIHNLALDAHASAQGEYVDMDAKVTADTLQVAEFTASRLRYEIRTAHLHGPTLSALARGLETAQAQSADSIAYAQKTQDLFKTHGIEILVRDPVIEIPTIQLVMPEGELLVSMKVSAQGLTREELNGPPALMRLALVKHMQASADVRIDTALLDKMLDSTGKGDRLATPLQGMQQQGYLKLDGKALTTHLTYRNGQLEVNGLPFPAVGPMSQRPHP